MRTRRASAAARLLVAVSASVAALLVAVPATFVPAGHAGPQARLARPRTALGASSSASALDTLWKLPEFIQDAVDDVADMFGAQGAEDFSPVEVSSLGMAEDGISKNGLLQTMSIRAAAGSERRMARQLTRFVEHAQADPAVTTVASVRNPEDPCEFTVLLRYASMDGMMEHQTGDRFKDLMESFEPHLERPIGLYMLDEQLGQLGMARHPFGPGGEGGRDDAIYSSRKGRR